MDDPTRKPETRKSRNKDGVYITVIGFLIILISFFIYDNHQYILKKYLTRKVLDSSSTEVINGITINKKRYKLVSKTTKNDCKHNA